jgi:hypothetical protein
VYYDFTLTIPANTTESSPTEDVVRVTHGVLHRIEVAFPAGCAGLAHLVILYREFQLYPTNPEGNFASDNYTIPIDDYFELFDHPYTLKLRGWNLDDTYSHTITVRLGIYPEDVAAKLYGRRRKADQRLLYESFGIPYPEV